MNDEGRTERVLLPIALGAAALVTVAWNAVLGVWLYGLGMHLFFE